MCVGAESPGLRVSVQSVLPAPPARRGWWRVTFGIHNHGVETVQVHDAWLPHGQFRGEARIPLDVTLHSGQTHALESLVHVDEPPLSVVHNAFLILRATTASGPTRLFVRLRVPVDAQGIPCPEVDRVTCQST